MIIGIDPKVDYAFKHMLGRDATRSILIDVIDSVLNPPPGRRIQENGYGQAAGCVANTARRPRPGGIEKC